MDKIIPGKKVILLSEESMKVVEDAIANPPAPTAKLREVINRNKRPDHVMDFFLNPIPKHENDSRTMMQIIKGRQGGTGRVSLNMLVATESTYKSLMDVGVPETMAQKLNLQLMAEHFMKDRKGSFKDLVNEMASRIKLQRGNWCMEIRPPKPNTQMFVSNLEAYMQLAVYRSHVVIGMHEFGAWRRMNEMKEDIKFYSDAIIRDIEFKNKGDEYHWLTYGTLLRNVIVPLLQTGVVDHSKIVFFYDTKTKLNLS